MTDHAQLTIDGRSERPPAAPAAAPAVAVPLFVAPQTIRGQIALPTNEQAR